jgi:hypothetical protein
VRLVRLRRAVLLSVLHACGGLVCAALYFLIPSRCATGTPSEKPQAAPSLVYLKVEASREVVLEWGTYQATFEENAVNTWLTLKLRSKRNVPVAHAAFYAELFDGSGRFCFSSFFTLERNREGQGEPLDPGGIRTLYSVSADLASASVPKLMRLYPAARRSGDAIKLFTSVVPIRVPPTVQAASVPAYPDWQTFWLNTLHQANDLPILDLALVDGEVDSEGRISSAHVIQTLCPSVSVWTRTFIEHLHFRPATINFTPKPGRALLLVRALVRRCKDGESPLDPPASPWIRDYVEDIRGAETPSVNILTLNRCAIDRSGSLRALDVGQSGFPDCIYYGGGGTEWSIGNSTPTP